MSYQRLKGLNGNREEFLPEAHGDRSVLLVLHWVNFSVVDSVESFVVCDWISVSLWSFFHDGKLKCFRFESVEHQLTTDVSGHDPVLLVFKVFLVDSLAGGLNDEAVVAEEDGLHHSTVGEGFLRSTMEKIR